jgi:hypothetical protein
MAIFTLSRAPARNWVIDRIFRRLWEGLQAERWIVANQLPASEHQTLLAKVQTIVLGSNPDTQTKANPWEVLDDLKAQIASAPDSAVVLEFLVKDAWDTQQKASSRPEMALIASSISAEIARMSATICQMASTRLLAYTQYERACQDWDRARKDARRKGRTFTERRPSLTEGCWPADIYRAYGRPIRFLSEKVGQADAKRLYRQLVLESTLPVEEMESPEWLDSYTGVAEAREQPVTIRSDYGLEEEIAFIQDENLSWTADDYRAHLNAQRGGFNADADEIALLDDETDSVEKDFSFKGDWSTTEGAGELRTLLREEIFALRERVENCFANHQLLEDSLEEAIQETQSAVRTSPESARLLRMLQAQAGQHLPQDVAAVALEFQSELCWTMEDLATIQIGTMNLARWIELMGDDFLEQFQDGSPQWSEISQVEVDAFADDTIFAQALVNAPRSLQEVYRRAKSGDPKLAEEAFQSAMGEVEGLVSRAMARAQAEEIKGEALQRIATGAKDKATRRAEAIKKSALAGDEAPARQAFWRYAAKTPTKVPGNHPAFIYAALQAAASGTLSQDGQIAAGWEAYRECVCPEGNRKYHEARAAGASHKDAMSGFWKLFNLKFPRKEQIRKPVTTGLVLDSGRTVSWPPDHLADQRQTGRRVPARPADPLRHGRNPRLTISPALPTSEGRTYKRLSLETERAFFFTNQYPEHGCAARFRSRAPCVSADYRAH